MQPVQTDEYTVWLEPSPQEGEELRACIEDFAKRAGTPVFLPHVTLVPGLHGSEEELIEKMRRLAGSESFSIQFGGTKVGDVYHKCLYLECERGEALMSLRGRAEELFDASTPYHPHLSLAYGVPEGQLRDIFVRESAKHVVFTARRISLWLARGKVEDWKKIQEFLLTD
jgi:2'-5' RNA ligase